MKIVAANLPLYVRASRGATLGWSRGALSLAASRVPAEVWIDHPLDGVRVWLPHLAPKQGSVIGDRVFRSPAILLFTHEIVLAFLPDLHDVARATCATWLDYDHRRRRIALGAGSYHSEDHLLFVRDDERRNADVRLRLHVLTSARPADLASPYGMVARWLWHRYGKPIHQRGGCQQAPLERYAEWIVRWAFSRQGWEETLWQSFELHGRRAGAPVLIVDVAQHPSRSQTTETAS